MRVEENMKSLTVRFVVAVLAFLVGVGAASVWPYRRARPAGVAEQQSVGRTPEPPAVAAAADGESQAEESPEAKAVRLAEEFIARNGYTDLPPDRDGLSYETVEWGPNDEETLRRRRDTLGRKAYGVRHGGRMGAKGGWTVVFRAPARYGDDGVVWGRAVTMDKDFQNLRVEHKDFPLAKVDRKF
jgi:hypothetical protein